MQENCAVLIIDDDPNHLQIYTWILKSAGFTPVPALAKSDGVDLPVGQPIHVAVLDYRLGGRLKATDAARVVNETFPQTPIILLSDLYDVPDDISPYIKAFVRKGQPEKLVATIRKFAFPADTSAAKESG
jgi:DNA-binding response OmpR family regulator